MQRLAAWALVFNAFVFGVSWWPFKTMQAHGLHPLWATFLVYALALIGLVLHAPQAWRSFLRQPLLWLLLLAAGLTNVGFNWGVTIGDVIRVVLLFYLMPAWTLPLAWLLLGERPTGGSLARLLLALTGVALVLKTPLSPWPLPDSLADYLALAGGLGFALTNVLLRRLRDTPEAARMQAMFAGGGLLALLTALSAQALGHAPALPAPTAGWVLPALLTCGAFLAANTALQYGAARLPAAGASLIMLTEVVFASATSLLAGAAELHWRTVFGGSLIMLAALWAALPSDASGASQRGDA